MKLPNLTAKQQDILRLLYRYRFLNRIQIQRLMGHKDYRRINAWLKDLRAKHYVEWIYSTHFLEKTKPAVYYLGLNGIRLLKTTDDYPLVELRKRYREYDRTEGFIARCVLIAECYINLEAKANQQTHYEAMTQADYAHPDHGYHFLTESETIAPHLCIVKEERTKEGDTTTNYLLEVFDATLPRYRIKNRLKQYITYLSDNEWESGDNDPPPIVLLVCPRTTDLIYAKRRTKKLLESEWDEDDEDRPHVRFTTTEQLKRRGITAKIWEEGRELYDL